MSIVLLILLLISSSLHPADSARVTSTVEEVQQAAAKATKIPLSASTWANGHRDTIKKVAYLEGRDLNDNDRFSIQNMAKYESLMHEVFGDEHIEKLMLERQASLLEARETPGIDHTHLVTHDLDHVIDVLDDAHEVHKNVHLHHSNLVELHKHIRDNHPEHHGVVSASLFELVAKHKAHLAESDGDDESASTTTTTKNILQRLKDIMSKFLRALNWLWNKLKSAFRIIAHILLHIVGNTYVGLGLDARVLPVASAGPLFQLCFDASGLLLGTDTAGQIIIDEFQKMQRESSKIADKDMRAVNGASETTGGTEEGKLLLLQIQQKFRAAGMRSSHLKTLSQVVEEGNDKDKDNKEEEEDDIPESEYEKLDESNSIEDADRPREVVIQEKETAVSLDKNEGMILDAGDDVVPETELKKDDSTMSSDGADEPKGKKKNAIKKLLLTLKTMVLSGLRNMTKAGAGITQGQEALQAAQGHTGPIKDGAIRVCLSLPFLGIIPSAPRLTLGLSLAMIQGFAKGAKQRLEPYLKSVSAKMHDRAVIKSLDTGQFNVAQKKVALEMFLWQNMCISQRADKQEEMLKKYNKLKKKNIDVNDFKANQEEEKRIAAKFRFLPELFKSHKQQSNIAAKDRHGIKDPAFAAERIKIHNAKFLSTQRKESVDVETPEVAAANKEKEKMLREVWQTLLDKEDKDQWLKPWLQGAENQLIAYAEDWVWALEKHTADSVLRSTSTKQSLGATISTFVEHQLPFFLTKILSDQMGSLANMLTKVLGNGISKQSSTAGSTTTTALIQTDLKGTKLVKNAEKISGVVRHPFAKETLFLGDTADLVFDSKSFNCGSDNLVVELRQDAGIYSNVHGRWEIGPYDLEKAVLGDFGLHINAADKEDDGDRGKICGNLMGDLKDACKHLAIKVEKPGKQSNPKNRDLTDATDYFFRLSCSGKSNNIETTREPRFEIKNKVRQERSPCKETLMMTFGLFPLKWPIGVDADLIKCSSSAVNIIKNKISAMKNRKPNIDNDDENKKSIEEVNDEVEEDFVNGSQDETNAEEDQAALELSVAQQNSEHGISTASKTAKSSPSCSRLKVYGGVGIDLGIIDLAMSGIKATINVLKAAVSVTLAVKTSFDGSAIETIWLPSKRELELLLLESGKIESMEDPKLQELLKPIDDITDPDKKLSAVQLMTLKTTDKELMLIIMDKQEKELNEKKINLALAGAKAVKDVALSTLKYYMMLSAAEALKTILEGTGLGFSVAASFGPLGSAFQCMGSMVINFGKKVISRLRRKSMCQKECIIAVAKNKDSAQAELEQMSNIDYEQCDHESLKLDAENRPQLPTCQLSPKSMFSSTRIAYCFKCVATGEECNIDMDCATGLCHQKVCLRTHLEPGTTCSKHKQCTSGECHEKTCTVRNNNRCVTAKAKGGTMGGCRCANDEDCGGSKCLGFKESFFGDTKGVCIGNPPEAICSPYDNRMHCCEAEECEWTSGADSDNNFDGSCEASSEKWPKRKTCDLQVDLPTTVEAGQTLLQENSKNKRKVFLKT